VRFAREVCGDKTASVPWLARDSVGTGADLLGLGLMSAASLDKIRSEHSERDPLGEKGRTSLDLSGLATMTAPVIAQIAKHRELAAHGHPTRWYGNPLTLAGLGALATPVVDKLQAQLRAAPGEDWEQKQLLGHGAHQALELGGYGAMLGQSLHGAAHQARDGNWGRGVGGNLAHAAGYGVLMAPTVEEVVRGHDAKPILAPTPSHKSLLELVGLLGLMTPADH
jgi:hypothetical protein